MKRMKLILPRQYLVQVVLHLYLAVVYKDELNEMKHQEYQKGIKHFGIERIGCHGMGKDCCSFFLRKRKERVSRLADKIIQIYLK